MTKDKGKKKEEKKGEANNNNQVGKDAVSGGFSKGFSRVNDVFERFEPKSRQKTEDK